MVSVIHFISTSNEPSVSTESNQLHLMRWKTLEVSKKSCWERSEACKAYSDVYILQEYSDSTVTFPSNSEQQQCDKLIGRFVH